MSSWQNNIKLLIVEDEADQRDIVKDILEQAGYAVDVAESAEEALDKLNAQPFNVIFSDWKLPGKDGIELLHEVKREAPDIAFVMATGHGSVEHAISAIKAGADDYLSKPYKRQTLLFTLEKVCENKRIKHENQTLKAALQEQTGLIDMLGRTASMQKLFKQVERVATTNATILIGGESGTGKELAARAIHQLSARAKEPFIAVNCAAIPESLAEAEFFGAEKGAYTGADKQKTGKFEAAQGGTIFLDEIAELPLNLQAKLLRLIQEGVVVRIGSHKEIALDVRILTATHRDLREQVDIGEFREDLFYRLNVIPIVMPPLRERRDDIPALTRHFAKSHAERYSLPEPVFTRDALDKMMSYHWPGNVRELSNFIERQVLLSDVESIQASDLPELVTTQVANETFRLPAEGFSWEAHERDCLRQALELSENNRAEAARILDLPYKAFLYRLEKYGL